MISCLRIVVTDPDPDYLGIEIFASGSRFAGATKIYAALDELSRLSTTIAGFPTSSHDERRYVFGTKDTSCAGGYCSLRLYCSDGAGHSHLEVEIVDDDSRYPNASARFTFPVLPADLDEFIRQLNSVDRNQSGDALLKGPEF